MLIDKVKEKEWANANLLFMKPGDSSIKESICFKVDESINAFLDDKSLSGKQTKLQEISIPQFLPYDNMTINYLDGIDWFSQCELKNSEGSRRLIINLLTSQRNELDLIDTRIFSIVPKPFMLIDNDLCVRNLGYYSIIKNTYTEVQLVEKKLGYLAYDSLWGFTWGLIRFLNFLSCRNVVREKNNPPIKLQNKRMRAGKLPLSSYYTLKIKPSSSKADYESKDLWSNRVHLCRGHIKTYTKEKPLFGKIVGNIWCPPHARGDKAKGVIAKDYEVKVNA